MNKVLDIFGKEIEFDCMGCDIANHKLIPPGGYVYEDEFINVSADPEIPINGFMVLGISKHIRSLNELSNSERKEVTKILNKTIEIIKKVNISNEVLLIQEEKAKHFHIWIVPMHDWMAQFGKNVRNIKEIINYAKQNFEEENKKELLESIEKIKIEFSKYEKTIRKAVRCYLIKDNKVMTIKYKENNTRAGYYDIPGGKIENGETSEQTAIREMKEETGIDIKNLRHKGIMTIEYPDRKYVFDTFISSECEGKLQESEENTSEWIDIKELLGKEKLLSTTIILDRFFIKGLIDDNCKFSMNITVDDKENVLDIDYNLE